MCTQNMYNKFMFEWNEEKRLKNIAKHAIARTQLFLLLPARFLTAEKFVHLPQNKKMKSALQLSD